MRLVSPGQKTAAAAARLFSVHPATVSRLLQRGKESLEPGRFVQTTMVAFHVLKCFYRPIATQNSTSFVLSAL